MESKQNRTDCTTKVRVYGLDTVARNAAIIIITTMERFTFRMMVGSKRRPRNMSVLTKCAFIPFSCALCGSCYLNVYCFKYLCVSTIYRIIVFNSFNKMQKPNRKISPLSDAMQIIINLEFYGSANARSARSDVHRVYDNGRRPNTKIFRQVNKCTEYLLLD